MGEKPVDNFFHHNSYHVSSGAANFFIWEAQFTEQNLKYMQNIGQELGSTIDNDLSVNKQSIWCNAENEKPDVSFLNVNEGDSIEMGECLNLQLDLVDCNGYLTEAYVQTGEEKLAI